VRSLIEADVLPLDGRWLEPFAGSGAIIRAVPEVTKWAAMELRGEEAVGLRSMMADLMDISAAERVHRRCCYDVSE